MNLSKILRPEIHGFKPYLPGKPIEEVRKKFGLKKIVKLASNENSLGVSARALGAYLDCGKEIYRYPESSGLNVRKALAEHLKVNLDEIILGAGSDEIIELLGKAFFNKGDNVIVSEHAFIRYKMAADLMGSKTIQVPMKDNKHHLMGMLKKITPSTKALFIANPNNPTGTYVNRREVNEFFSFLKKRRLSPFIIFDEAYYEYSKFLSPDYPESLEYFKKGLNLILLRTFSKIYGLAGLRIGYGIMSRELVLALDRIRPPFNVSIPAQNAAIGALKDQTHVKKSLSLVEEGMNYLTHEFKKLGVDTLPSSGNFLMVNVFPWKGKEIFLKLMEQGVIVRAIDEYGFPNHIRVTIGLKEENKFFLEKFKMVLKRKKFSTDFNQKLRTREALKG
ncbi:MAG: histidinol-phosphate transaminase [Elusimicrobia bacterium RIFCSPLOWO2_02_FULL_39_32]|nr:MAG: histidinol-phosphate transaminase [Elusimicrobia bacterium GWA2_38_7]OGR81120.1 MAG: histidinol-phosphate transaminase [Elusimicrobia bacterium RIFCSPHIGHO2_02_FULL_39_36]OGR91008.1 MAG: histidinol-phosphate transaminase [Elusimicrobia bacterium RIFCSPLOWO2_02_FULL_39_32]OGR98316.1 MAG: histidinol-phosphate transaminase [Elusimicrobia bacterium RIFCSPLOWO2_12_FULL_39_28]